MASNRPLPHRVSRAHLPGPSGRRRPPRHDCPKSVGKAAISPNRDTESNCVVALVLMAIQASREIVIDAAPEKIMEALRDVDILPQLSPLHKNVEVLDCYPDGQPHHVKATVKIMGIVDNEILEYHWGP